MVKASLHITVPVEFTEYDTDWGKRYSAEVTVPEVGHCEVTGYGDPVAAAQAIVAKVGSHISYWARVEWDDEQDRLVHDDVRVPGSIG